MWNLAWKLNVNFGPQTRAFTWYFWKPRLQGQVKSLFSSVRASKSFLKTFRYTVLNLLFTPINITKMQQLAQRKRRVGPDESATKCAPETCSFDKGGVQQSQQWTEWHVSLLRNYGKQLSNRQYTQAAETSLCSI